MYTVVVHDIVFIIVCLIAYQCAHNQIYYQGGRSVCCMSPTAAGDSLITVNNDKEDYSERHRCMYCSAIKQDDRISANITTVSNIYTAATNNPSISLLSQWCRVYMQILPTAKILYTIPRCNLDVIFLDVILIAIHPEFRHFYPKFDHCHPKFIVREPGTKKKC